MKKLQQHRRAAQLPISIQALEPTTLEAVQGGHTVTSPRDPQSGLPTGQRT